MLTQQVTNRMADFGRCQFIGRDLIQQRLERVIVVSIDKCDPDRRVAQMCDCPQTAEAGTQNHHMWEDRHGITFI